MALMVGDDLRLWFRIVTGDDFPDANEDLLRALGDAQHGTARRLRALRTELSRAVAAIRAGFYGQAERAFAAAMSPFVDGGDNALDSAAAFFDPLGDLLWELALDVEYMKYVVILELSLLAAEFTWASEMTAFFGPVPMIWFSARLQMVRQVVTRLLDWMLARFSLLGKLAAAGRALLDELGWAGRAFLGGMVIGMGNQMLVTVGAQAIQFGRHTRDHWSKQYLSDAAVVGAVGGFLALPMSALGHRIGRSLARMLDTVFGRAHGVPDWHRAFAYGVAHVLHESLHEGATATIATAILTHQFTVDWANFTAGASSGVARVSGHLFGHILVKLANLAGITLGAYATNRAMKKRRENGGGHGDEFGYEPVPVPPPYTPEGLRGSTSATEPPGDGGGGRDFVPSQRTYDRARGTGGAGQVALTGGNSGPEDRGGVPSRSSWSTVDGLGAVDPSHVPEVHLAEADPEHAHASIFAMDSEAVISDPASTRSAIDGQDSLVSIVDGQGRHPVPAGGAVRAAGGAGGHGEVPTGEVEVTHPQLTANPARSHLVPKVTAPGMTPGQWRSGPDLAQVTSSAGAPALPVATAHHPVADHGPAGPGGTPRTWAEVGKLAEHIEERTEGRLSRNATLMEAAKRTVGQTFREGHLTPTQRDAVALVVAYKRLSADEQTASQYAENTAITLGVQHTWWPRRLRLPGGALDTAGPSFEDSAHGEDDSRYGLEIHEAADAAEDAASARDAAAAAEGRARFARAKAERDLAEAIEFLRSARGGVLGTEAAREHGARRVAEARTALASAREELEIARTRRDEQSMVAGDGESLTGFTGHTGFGDAEDFRFDEVADFEEAAAFRFDDVSGFEEAAAVEFDGAVDFRNAAAVEFGEVEGFENGAVSWEVVAPGEAADVAYDVDSGESGGFESVTGAAGFGDLTTTTKITGSAEVAASEEAEEVDPGEEMLSAAQPVDVSREAEKLEEAQRRLDVAERYLHGTELSAQAAHDAERAAAGAVEAARNALARVKKAHTEVAASVGEANASAAAARKAFDSMSEVVRDTLAETVEADRVFQAGRSAVARLAQEIEALDHRIGDLDRRIGDLDERLVDAGRLPRNLSGSTLAGLSRTTTAFSAASGGSGGPFGASGFVRRRSRLAQYPSGVSGMAGFRSRWPPLSRSSTGFSGKTVVTEASGIPENEVTAVTGHGEKVIEGTGPGTVPEEPAGSEKGAQRKKSVKTSAPADAPKSDQQEKPLGKSALLEETGDAPEPVESREVTESDDGGMVPDGGEAQRSALADHRAALIRERAGLVETRKGRHAELTKAEEAAREADEKNRLARRGLTEIATTVQRCAREAAGALDAAQAVRSAAERGRDTAEGAAAEAGKAKGTAKSAAEQGRTEAVFTLLSSVPPGSLLGIEHVGSLDGLVAAVATQTRLPADRVRDEIAALGGEGLVKAMNERTLTIDGGEGPVTLDILAIDLHRPADSRTRPSSSLPPAAFLRQSKEHAEPHSDASSRTLPLRVPLMVFEPVSVAAAVAGPIGIVRPFAFVGATGRRTLKFDSSSSITREQTSTDRPALDTTMAFTFRGRSGRPVVATVDVGVRIAEVVRGMAESRPLSEAAVAELRRRGVSLPDTLKGTPEISYVGTSPGWELKTTTKQSRNHSSSGGSDGAWGGGLFGGLQHDWGAWFIGVFGEIGNGFTGGVNRMLDREQIHNAVRHMLIYRIDAGETGYAVVAPHVARAAGLPLPGHLQGTAKVSGGGARRYVIGTDDIAAVPGAEAIAELASRGLSRTGRATVEAEFSDPDQAHIAVSDAIYGGHQIHWTEDDREHTLDIYVVPVPPSHTEPSGLMKLKLEDKTTIQWRRVATSIRSAKAGFGGEVRPVFDDNPAARKPSPELGDPDPYQGSGTSSRSLPAAAITANWDTTRGGKPGRLAKDARVSTYEGEFRDWDGTVDVIAVHSSTKRPNRFQRWVLGGMMTSFGGPAGTRLAEPPRGQVEKAFGAVSGDQAPSAEVWRDSTAGLVRGRVNNAVQVAVPVDKLDWASRPLPESTMTPGLYLGPPPRTPGDAAAVEPAALGEYAAVEDVHVSRNHIEAVEIALAKKVFGLSGPVRAARESPFLGGTWASPGTRRFTETRTGEGTESSTTYWYKTSSLMRLNNAARHAISQVLGRVSARGTAALGLNGQSSGTGEMVQSGRLSDLTGRLDVTQAYFAPRLVAVRAMGRLQRNQNGEAVVSSALSQSKGVGGRFNLSVVPKRLSMWGANLRVALNASFDRAHSHGDEALPGTKQSNEYKGPTAFLVFDTRSTFAADLKIRTLVHTSTFAELPVTVDEPNGTVVQLPARHAAELYRSLGLPVPPELAAAVPPAKPPEKRGVPAQTLMPGKGGYASHNGTNVIFSVLHGDDPLAGVRERLGALGVEGEWRQRVVDQVEELLATPFGYVELRNVLFAAGRTSIQVAASDALFDDVVDIEVAATPVERKARITRAATPLEPDALINVGYLTTSHLDQTTTAKQLELPFETGFTGRTKAPVSPGHLGEDGTPVPGKPGTGAAQGTFAPRPTVGRSSRTQVIQPTSLAVKSTSQLKSDKVATDHREVTYSLRISRRREPMPGFETLALGLPDFKNWDKEATAPVFLPGAVALSVPDRTVAPPLAAPAELPVIEVVQARPHREPLFRASDGFHPEAIGRYTIEAVRKAVYAQLSAKPLPEGVATPRAVERAVDAKSSYTREGGAAEYILNVMTSGTSLHGGLHAMATGEDYQARNVLARKHLPFDKLFDLKLTLDYRDFEVVTGPPDGVNLEIIHEVETSRPYGSSKVEGHVLGETNPTMGSGDAPGNGDLAPVTVRTYPYGGVLPNHDRLVYATVGRTFRVQGTKYVGRFYLVKANADIYAEIARHKSNRVADLFSSPDSVVVVRSKDDLYVRVHEDLALRKGILTLGQVWSFAGRRPGAGLVLGSTPEGAVLRPAGEAATGPVTARPGVPDDVRGRTLHIGAGVGLDQVVDFVRSLPADMRPGAYTVDAQVPFTPADVLDGVVGKHTDTDVAEPAAEETMILRGGGDGAPDFEEWTDSSDGDSGFSADTADATELSGSEADRLRRLEPASAVPTPASVPGLADVDGLAAALAFDATWDGEPPAEGAFPAAAAGSSAAVMKRAPVLAGVDGEGLVKAARQLTGPGSRSVLLIRPDDVSTDGRRRGYTVNLVRSGNDLYLVNVRAGTRVRLTLDELWAVGSGLGRVYTLSPDAGRERLVAAFPAPVPPGKDAEPYEIAVYEDEKRKHELRTPADAGEDIPLPGVRGRLVQWLGGLRLVAAVVVSPSYVAELSATLARDVIALVSGPGADDPPRWLLFPPAGRPLPVRPEDLPPEVQTLL